MFLRTQIQTILRVKCGKLQPDHIAALFIPEAPPTALTMVSQPQTHTQPQADSRSRESLVCSAGGRNKDDATDMTNSASDVSLAVAAPSSSSSLLQQILLARQAEELAYVCMYELNELASQALVSAASPLLDGSQHLHKNEPGGDGSGSGGKGSGGKTIGGDEPTNGEEKCAENEKGKEITDAAVTSVPSSTDATESSKPVDSTSSSASSSASPSLPTYESLLRQVNKLRGELIEQKEWRHICQSKITESHGDREKLIDLNQKLRWKYQTQRTQLSGQAYTIKELTWRLERIESEMVDRGLFRRTRDE